MKERLSRDRKPPENQNQERQKKEKMLIRKLTNEDWNHIEISFQGNHYNRIFTRSQIELVLNLMMRQTWKGEHIPQREKKKDKEIRLIEKRRRIRARLQRD